MLLQRVGQRGNLFGSSTKFVTTNQQSSSTKQEAGSTAPTTNNTSSNNNNNNDDQKLKQDEEVQTHEQSSSTVTIDDGSNLNNNNSTHLHDHDHHSQHNHNHSKECRCYTHPPVDNSLVQTLEEVAFDNGIWSLISRGASTQKIREFLIKNQHKHEQKNQYGFGDDGDDDDENSLNEDSASKTSTKTRTTKQVSSWNYWCTKKCPSGYTPLLYAARAGNLETVMLLIENGADAKSEVTPETKQSALHRAAGVGNYEICEYLLRFGGADRTQKDSRGLTAFDWVEQRLYKTAESQKKDEKDREALLKLLAP